MEFIENMLPNKTQLNEQPHIKILEMSMDRLTNPVSHVKRSGFFLFPFLGIKSHYPDQANIPTNRLDKDSLVNNAVIIRFLTSCFPCHPDWKAGPNSLLAYRALRLPKSPP